MKGQRHLNRLVQESEVQSEGKLHIRFAAISCKEACFLYEYHICQEHRHRVRR